MNAALGYLLACSAWNRCRVRLGRLRKPQYLIGALLGVGYFGYFLIQPWLSSQAGAAAAARLQPPPILATYISLGLLVTVFLTWLLPSKPTRLDFTEAEIAFLFPAPLSRRTLIHYRLFKTLIGLAFTSGIMTIFTWRLAAAGGLWRLAFGWWVMMTAMELHRLGAGFTRTRLLQRGVPNWQRRLAVLAAGAIAGWFAWNQIQAARASLPEVNLADLEGLGQALQSLGDRGALAVILAPFRWLIAPMAAPDLPAFLRALVPALGLLAAGYWWILLTAVAFEEEALAHAAQRAQAAEAVRAGNWHLVGARAGARRSPFKLRPLGARWVALPWKNLIAAQAMISPRFILLLGIIGLSASVGMVAAGAASAGTRMAGFMVLPFIPMLTLVTPDLLRFDLRQDLPLADVLKTLPLPGWQLVLGEVLAPALLVTGLQYGLIALAVVLIPGTPPAGLPAPARLLIALSAAPLVPVVNVAVLLMHNATALLFPAWVRLGPEGAQGFEAMGQRMLMMLGQFLVLALAMLPAVGLGAVVFFAVRLAANWQMALPPAALAAAAVVALEASLGLKLLGSRFERMDITD